MGGGRYFDCDFLLLFSIISKKNLSSFEKSRSGTGRRASFGVAVVAKSALIAMTKTACRSRTETETFRRGLPSYAISLVYRHNQFSQGLAGSSITPRSWYFQRVQDKTCGSPHGNVHRRGNVHHQKGVVTHWGSFINCVTRDEGGGGKS